MSGPMTVRECGARFSFTATGRCVLSPGHKGEHKEPGGITWPSLDADHMTAAWRARFPEVDKYLIAVEGQVEAMRQAAKPSLKESLEFWREDNIRQVMKREAFGKAAGYHDVVRVPDEEMSLVIGCSSQYNATGDGKLQKCCLPSTHAVDHKSAEGTTWPKLPQYVPKCRSKYVDGSQMQQCALTAAHDGDHKSKGGTVWNNVPQYNPLVQTGRTSYADAKPHYMPRPGNAVSALSRCLDHPCELEMGHVGSHMSSSIFNASYPSQRAWTNPATEAQAKGTAIHKAIEETMRSKCAVCPNPINHNNPQAVFCSSTCASRAATHYNAANTTLDQAITAEGEKYGKELTDTLHKHNRAWDERFKTAMKTSDRALRFLCGLNLQDHDVKEQREALVIVRELQAALRPGKVGK